MNKKPSLLLLGLTLLFFSSCTQKEKTVREVSSGEGAATQDQIITVPTDLGSWILSKATPGEPVRQTLLTVSFKCQGERAPTVLDDKPIEIYTSSERLSRRAYSWGEIRTLAPKVYNQHKGAIKPQGVKSVIWVKYWKAPEFDFSGKTPTKKPQVEKMVVLDLAEVCS